MRKWLQDSNFLIIVNVADVTELHELALEAGRRGILSAIVIEPDLGDTMTAVALGPGIDSQRLCASLPLALKGCNLVTA